MSWWNMENIYCTNTTQWVDGVTVNNVYDNIPVGLQTSMANFVRKADGSAYINHTQINLCLNTQF